nr:GNAT family N-acetyltransferase [Nocardiopsis mwathae]
MSGQEIIEFLEEHVEEMRSVSPPESTHALDLEGLRRPEVTFWSVMDGVAIAGCGALKELAPDRGEIKSMRTAAAYKGRGVASMVMRNILSEARGRGYRRLSLETGSCAFFAPARNFYLKHGFSYCKPFSGYRDDPNSVFMEKVL